MPDSSLFTLVGRCLTHSHPPHLGVTHPLHKAAVDDFSKSMSGMKQAVDKLNRDLSQVALAEAVLKAKKLKCALETGRIGLFFIYTQNIPLPIL